MSIEHDADYHGQEYVEGQDARDAPSGPTVEAERADGPTERGHVGTFAKVVFEGSYGIGCGGKQKFTRGPLTLAHARKIKWDYFGLCSNHMVCLDQFDNVVHEE